MGGSAAPSGTAEYPCDDQAGEGSGVAQKIEKRVKMGNSPAVGTVDHADGRFDYRDPAPGGLDQDFQFELVTSGGNVQGQHLGQGVDAKSALGIGCGRSAGTADPEIGETTTEPAGPGRAGIQHAHAPADDNRPATGRDGLDQGLALLGNVLAIGIQGDGPREAGLGGGPEARQQGRALSAVDPVAQEPCPAIGYLRQSAVVEVRGTVIDDEQAKAQRGGAAHHLGHSAAVVVNRDDHGEWESGNGVVFHGVNESAL
ncbi:hypothetical protein DESC_830017 [Desulfosarcina cetonica]|nr:hypothetical protein DESC_830017 [Desulfosarcina cetonica]